MIDTKALREEYATVHTEAGKVISAADKDNKRALTPEEKEGQDKRYARLDAIKAMLDEDARFSAYALQAATAVANGGTTVQLPAEAPGQAEFLASEGRQFAAAGKDGSFDVAAFKRGLNKFAQTGETRQLYVVTSGTQSGAYLPKQVLQPVEVRRLQNAWRGVLSAYNYMPIEVPTPASFSLPVADDTAVVGEATSESATSGTATDPAQTGAISIAPTLYGSKQFWYSNTMVLGQGWDVAAFTLPLAQKRIDKIQESTWTANVVTNGTAGKTLAATTAITYAELLDWEHSLSAAYRTDAAFVVTDALYKALRGLVDENSRPIMDLDPTNVFAGKIHGKPVIVSDYFEAFTADNVIGAFVSADAVKIVDVQDARLARYSNYPARPDQIGFEMFQNGDFGFVANGLRTLKTAIS